MKDDDLKFDHYYYPQLMNLDKDVGTEAFVIFGLYQQYLLEQAPPARLLWQPVIQAEITPENIKSMKKIARAKDFEKCQKELEDAGWIRTKKLETGNYLVTIYMAKLSEEEKNMLQTEPRLIQKFMERDNKRLEEEMKKLEVDLEDIEEGETIIEVVKGD